MMFCGKPATVRVHDYQTGARLPGPPSAALTAASLAVGSTGAVGAYRDTDGVWQHLRDDEMSAYDEARSVYVI